MYNNNMPQRNLVVRAGDLTWPLDYWPSQFVYEHAMELPVPFVKSEEHQGSANSGIDYVDYHAVTAGPSFLLRVFNARD